MSTSGANAVRYARHFSLPPIGPKGQEKLGDSSILIVGAGTVGRSLCDAFGVGFPDAQISIWNRTQNKARALADTLAGVTVADDLETAVRNADIIVSATMSTEPIIHGDWLRPGQHLNLIGAYRPDMRETDDTALQQARVFVDSFETTIGHIGEIDIPLTTGAITRDHLVADYYNLTAFKRGSDDDITVFKNGGGAHLDLITCRYVLEKWQAKQRQTQLASIHLVAQWCD
jgi:ornithine cyclodeaminase/alanine dehydrogenase-like protein (mu-crystallin family)